MNFLLDKMKNQGVTVKREYLHPHETVFFRVKATQLHKHNKDEHFSLHISTFGPFVLLTPPKTRLLSGNGSETSLELCEFCEQRYVYV